MGKLLVLDSHPIQYRAPLYRCLCEQLERAGHRLDVVFASDSSLRGATDSGFGQPVKWDEPLLEGYTSEFLPTASQSVPAGFHSLSGKGVAALVASKAPDVLFLNGLGYRFCVSALTAARLRGIPVWLRSETQDFAFCRSIWKSLIRATIYRIAYSQIHRFFAIGELNAAHYQAHGVPLSRIRFARYCVVDRFSLDAGEKESRRAALRQRLNFAADTVVLLFCGKLIEKKNPAVIIEALKRLSPSTRQKFAAVFVGSGELETSLREAAQESGVQTVFSGFVNQSEIADYYLAADVLVLPSRQMGETWGLVANEALMAACPVILSRHAGSSIDFARFEGVTVIDPEAEPLANALSTLSPATNPSAIRAQMKDYTIEAAADAIAKEFQSALS